MWVGTEMNSGSHQESGLSKNLWSDADYEEMGRHDATVHGLYLQRTDDILPRLLVDLDSAEQVTRRASLGLLRGAGAG